MKFAWSKEEARMLSKMDMPFDFSETLSDAHLEELYDIATDHMMEYTDIEDDRQGSDHMKIFGLVILTEKEYCKTREDLTQSLCSEFEREKEGIKRAHEIKVYQLKNAESEAWRETSRIKNQHDAEVQELSNTIREQRKTIEALSEIEAKYKQLTARDEKGRFVKRAGA